MGWFGRWFGGAAATVVEPDPVPDPIPVPVVFGDPEYTDIVQTALARLSQQFRGDSES